MDRENKFSKENRILTKLIFQGKTVNQIANEMNYSKATVSNRIYALYGEYSAKSRTEFIINVLGDIIQKYKNEIQGYNNEIRDLKTKINVLKFHLEQNK